MRPRGAGITLVELLLAIALLTLIVGSVSQLLLSSYQSEEALTTQNEMQKRAQQAADTVVDSLRSAIDLSSGTAAEVTATFRNGDTLRYYRQQDELRCDSHVGGIVQHGTVLCRDVTGLHFAYFSPSGASWTPAASATEAQALEVSVSLASGKEQATEASAVKLRNKS